MGEAEGARQLSHTLAIHAASPFKHLSFSSSFQHSAITSWIKENICKRQCYFFDKDDSSPKSKPDVCKCGYPKTDHVNEAIKSEDFTGESWNRHRHVREVPTDAFGDITFGSLGQKPGKYARVSTNTSPDILYQLLTEQWKLSPPNLLISVTGGAKDFYLKARLKNMFRRGLIKVAQTTGAWIITGGTHVGVMKHVGQAVRDNVLSCSSTQGRVVAIGVATWGIIHNRDSLVYSEGCFPAQYVMDVKGQGRLSNLDNNHTHFLLVDDGTHGHYGVEIELRSRLEKCISENGATIPVVCVVLDGGPGTLNTMYNTILNGTPCVVLEGSGRVADLIADVAELPLHQSHLSAVSHPVCFMLKIQDIIRRPHLLTVFRVSEECHWDVDVAILQALLKASRTNKSQGTEYWKSQLELAIAWNRVDIAETEIFTEDSQWESSELHWAMFSALVGNKPEFVRLLLENGVSLREFLQDEQTLRELYTRLPNCIFLSKLAKRVQSSRKQLLKTRVPYLFICLSKNQTVSEGSLRATIVEERDPGKDLFLWAVVQSNKELAEIAWEQCRDCTSAALAASKILKKMAEDIKDTDKAEEMKELANHYEKHAIGVFSECYNSDQERAQKLLVRASPLWGRTTCLRLALEANDKSFVAQSGVQNLLTQIWCGGLSVDNPVWRVMTCMVFFPLIYTKFLVFRSLLALCSPQVKFYWNIVFYFAFLLLFAVVLMMDFQATPSAWEVLLYIWLFSLVCEEVRQVRGSTMYIQDLWNILDVLSILLFIIGLAFRLISTLFYAGKIVLCIDFVVFCLRLMAIFTISRTLGPKIIIVKRMMMDMFFFLFLLSIWVVAYGVAKQGILINNDSRLDWIFRGAVYEPYLTIFGNFPTNIDITFDINSCSMSGTDPLKPKCPVLDDNQNPVFPEWLTITLLCVYLLFANILLLNLLIAIFNFTFEEVQDNTDRIWKFQRYELIKEYHSRPAAPPPFIILSHIYLLISKMVMCRQSTTSKEFSKIFIAHCMDGWMDGCSCICLSASYNPLFN
uniref:Transient receptor potential cation channel, subfamily M, member 2 n=1 Tax=Mastacembelus armatus TaxID=205130 RepID=A0A7N8YI07_9TELE